jgi:hypothetical protein
LHDSGGLRRVDDVLMAGDSPRVPVGGDEEDLLSNFERGVESVGFVDIDAGGAHTSVGECGCGAG